MVGIRGGKDTLNNILNYIVIHTLLIYSKLR